MDEMKEDGKGTEIHYFRFLINKKQFKVLVYGTNVQFIKGK